MYIEIGKNNKTDVINLIEWDFQKYRKILYGHFQQHITNLGDALAHDPSIHDSKIV